MTLQIKDNCCTDRVRLHPIKAHMYYKDGGNYNEGVHIFFDKRQIWTAYYYHFADVQGWQLSHGIIKVRMSNDEFKRVFGDIEILGRVNK